jgi:predicted O-methyltransferase YrrM
MGLIYKASSKNNLIQYPLAAFKFLNGNKVDLHEKIILKAAKRLLKSRFNIDRWKLALDEIKREDYIPANKRDNNVVGNNINTMLGKWLYCSVRALEPEYIIETGIAHGNSSMVILNAIYKNGKGKLYSLDLPNNDTHADYNFEGENSETGWMVPEILKQYWTKVIGDSKKTLPELLDKLKNIDYFFHDSDHSYEHMTFEFNTIYPFLNKGGIISSDDINKNVSFQDFVAANSLNTILFTKGGSTVKT